MSKVITEWTNNVSVGISMMDHHNELLLTMIADLNNELDSQSNFAITQKLATLLDYYIFHIACEDIWMHHSKYNSIKEHNKDHARLCKMIPKIDIISSNYKTSTRSMIIKLRTSIIEHIEKHDMAYSTFINNKNLPQALSR